MTTKKIAFNQLQFKGNVDKVREKSELHKQFQNIFEQAFDSFSKETINHEVMSSPLISVKFHHRQK